MATDIEALLARLRHLEVAAADLYDRSFSDADRKYCHYLNCYPDANFDDSGPFQPAPVGAHNTPEDLERFREFARTLEGSPGEAGT